MNELQQLGPARPAPEGVDLVAFRPALRNYFRKRVAVTEVDDLVQDVFVNLLARRAPSPIQNIQGYTFSVASSVLCRHLNHSRRSVPTGRAPEGEGVADARAPSAEHEVLAVEGVRRLLAAMAKLPSRTQVVFSLHRFEETSYPIIARRLGITVSAVEKHMMAALKALREEFEAP